MKSNAQHNMELYKAWLVGTVSGMSQMNSKQ